MSDIFQLRIVLCEVSPLIWRRLQVRPTMTLAELHEVLLVLMDWSDDFLHLFSCHGRSYRIWRPHALEGDDAASVTLADLKLHPGEVPRYEYNFYVPWQLDLRLEAVVPERKGCSYPYLVAAGRAAPPEDLCGPKAYLERRRWHEYHPPIAALKDVVTAVQKHRAGEDTDVDDDALREALDRISVYVQYTSEKLDLVPLRQKLADLPKEARA